jgi:glycosyltransferase involved in cell wall biosynthesis
VKALILTHHQPFEELNGASQRTRNIAFQLAESGAQVKVVSIVSPKRKRKVPRSPNANIKVIEIANPLQWSEKTVPDNLIPPYLLTASLNYIFLSNRLISEKMDVVIAESPWVWGIARRIQSQLTVLNAQNCESDWNEIYLKRPFVSNFGRTWLRKLEKKACREADHILTVTEEDSSRLCELYGPFPENPTVIPNGFEQTSQVPVFTPVEKLKIKQQLNLPTHKKVALFVASETPHNKEALTKLTELMTKKIEESWIFLVAGNITKTGKRLKSGIYCLGEQRNLASFFQISNLFLNPIVNGSGSNVKVIEALGYGLPVISTPRGARGLPQNLSGLTITTLQNFPKYLNDLSSLSRPDSQQIKNFDWREIGNNLSKHLESWLNDT